MISINTANIHLYDFECNKLRCYKEYGTTYDRLKWSPDCTHLAVSSSR